MIIGINALYESNPLPTDTSIRLIKVLPEDSGGILNCQMRVIDLDESPKAHYTALSYTWGPPLPSQVEDQGKRWLITIEDSLCRVTANLFDCLTHFSHSSESQYKGDFWIDALCIDQNNDEERSEQVNMMAQIYQSAVLVIMWLGREDEETELACQGLAILLEHTRFNHDPGLLALEVAKDTFPAVSRLYHRSWFMRVWVIQELLLARKTKFLCGQHEMAWEDLAAVSGYLGTSNWRKSFGRKELVSISAPARLDAVRRKFKAEKVDDDLLYHLIRSRSFKAEKPKDKVYSLLGLIQAKRKDESNASLLYANYSLTDSEAYVAAAIHIFETSSNLLLLSHVEGDDYQTIPGLPSWVPDWSVTARTGLGVTGYKRFRASGELHRECILRPEDRNLELRGIFLDTATFVGDSKFDFDAETHAVNGELPRWLDILESLEDSYPIKTAYGETQSREEAFWRTLIADTAGLPLRCPAPPSLDISFRRWLLRMLVGTVKRALSIEAGAGLPEKTRADLRTLDLLAKRSEAAALLFPNSEEVLSYIKPNKMPQLTGNGSNSGHKLELTSTDAASDEFEATYSHSPNLRLFRTAKGFLGLGTTSMKDNDTIWIIPGSRIPLIFRKTANSRHYRLVGGAYLHGFMQGEALLMKTNEFETIVVE